MKVDARRAEAFLRDPGPIRLILLYGEDAGLVRERGNSLVRRVAGTSDDPFRVVELDRDTVSAMADEVASAPLTGGRRVLVLRNAGEFAVAAVQAALAGRGDGLIVLEAPPLSARSKLRTMVEAAPNAAAIACYPDDDRALAATIQATLGELGIGIDSDALLWLASQLGVDRAVTRREVEKLGLLVGRGGRVSLSDAQSCVGDLAGLSLEDALFSATAGDVAGTDRALELAMSEGASPVQILRLALAHIQRLHQARLSMTDGVSSAEAVKSVRPPIFFRRVRAFEQALNVWNIGALEVAATRLADAEYACKRTNAPSEIISRNVILGLAQRGATART